VAEKARDGRWSGRADLEAPDESARRMSHIALARQHRALRVVDQRGRRQRLPQPASERKYLQAEGDGERDDGVDEVHRATAGEVVIPPHHRVEDEERDPRDDEDAVRGDEPHAGSDAEHGLHRVAL